MAESIKEIFKRKLVSVGFVRTMGLFGATTLGIGALMGAGIYVLIGLAAGAAGPGVLALIPHLRPFKPSFRFRLWRTFPQDTSFRRGVCLCLQYAGKLLGVHYRMAFGAGDIFACAMYATGFAYYATTIFSQDVPKPLLKSIALAVIFLLTMLNCRGTRSGDSIQKILTWGNLLVLAILIGLTVPDADPKLMRPMFRKGLEGIGGAIAIIYVSFFGYQLIANNAEEIVDPEKTVPWPCFWPCS